MDFYKFKMKLFGWSWFDTYKVCGRPRRKDRMPSRLARAFRKRMDKREIATAT